MANPKLKRTSVQIKYTSSDGYRAEFGGHNMPVGWCSYRGNYSGTVFRCGQCIKLLQGSGE